jgi:hypothetical protein
MCIGIRRLCSVRPRAFHLTLDPETLNFMDKLTNHLKIDMPRNASLHRQSSCEVPARKVQGSTDNEVWNLRNGLRPNESHPMVGFGLRE